MTEISGGIGRKIVGKGRVRKDGEWVSSTEFRDFFSNRHRRFPPAFRSISRRTCESPLFTPRLVVNHSGLDPCPGVISQREKSDITDLEERTLVLRTFSGSEARDDDCRG